MTDANRLSSWDGYLPTPSVNQNPQVAMSQPAPSSPQQRDAQRQPDTGDQFAASENKPTTSEGASSESESVAWAKVVLAAQLHSEASVTSPTVRFYGPGTELQVVRREGAWFQVSDPVTQVRGWVLDEYLSSIGGPAPVRIATKTITEPPTVTKPTIQKSGKRSRSAKADGSETQRYDRKCRSVERPVGSTRRPPAWVWVVYVPPCPKICTRSMRSGSVEISIVLQCPSAVCLYSSICLPIMAIAL